MSDGQIVVGEVYMIGLFGASKNANDVAFWLHGQDQDADYFMGLRYCGVPWYVVYQKNEGGV